VFNTALAHLLPVQRALSFCACASHTKGASRRIARVKEEGRSKKEEGEFEHRVGAAEWQRRIGVSTGLNLV